MKSKADDGNTFAIVHSDSVLLMGNFSNLSLTTGKDLNVNGNLLPERSYSVNDLNRNIGSSSEKWSNIHVKNVNATNLVPVPLTSGKNTLPTANLGSSNSKWTNLYVVNVNGTSLSSSSDRRYKTEIKPLERALDKVIMLNGVTYKWRVSEFPEQQFDSNTHIGVIAQDVEEIFPELVSTDENGYKSVQYGNFAPVLIEAIKELKAEKDELQKEVEELKKMVEELMKKQ